mgnify:CR=1 FL=1
MRALPLDLTNDVVSSYDQTKTTVLGRAAKKTLTAQQGGKVVVGTPLNSWADTFPDSAQTPGRMAVSDNGHELQVGATSSAAGLLQCVLYDFNETTGVKTYVGRITLQLPNTTHTVRGIRVYNDSGATGWRILVATVGTVAASGGFFSAENIDKADFAPVIPTAIPVASAAGQKAVYWHQETGGTNNLTVCQGFGAQKADVPAVAGDLVIVANGLVASPNFYTFNAANTIVTVGALGVTTDWYSHKTGTITGLTGTFLLLNNYHLCVPTADSGAPVSVQGSLCLFIPGSVAFSLGKISELTSGATSWPSIVTADTANVANTSVAQTPLTAHCSNVLQKSIFQLCSGRWFVKKFINTNYELEFGSAANPQYRAGQSSVIDFYEFGGVTVVSTWTKNGWLHTVNNTAGQIGSASFDLRSLHQYDYSAIISKTFDVQAGTQLVSLSINSPVRSFGRFFYRTNLTTNFSTATTGWTLLPTDRVLTGISMVGVNKIQFKFQTRMERDSSTIPLQIIEAHLLYQPPNELGENWIGSVDNTTQNGASPARTAFRLAKAYASVVPKLYFRAYDDNGNLVASANTVDNPSFFEYSGNNGASWVALGTIPNTINTTELRYKWASPPGVRVTASLRES